MKIHVFYNVIAEVGRGFVTIHVGEPVELKEWGEFSKEAKSRLFTERVRELIRLLVNRESGSVELASKEAPIRLGGGFSQVEGRKLLLIRRDRGAPRLPLALDIPSGVFDEKWSHPLEMMVAESVEIVRKRGETLCFPFIGIYDEALMSEAEVVREALLKSGAHTLSISKVEASVIPVPDSRVHEVIYLGERIRGLSVAFEDYPPSIELVGLIKVEEGSYEYADGELTERASLLNREIHSINMHTGEDVVWQRFKVVRRSTLSKELSGEEPLTPKAATILMHLKPVPPNTSERDLGALSKGGVI